MQKNWARCIVKSHKTLVLSCIPIHSEREDAEKTSHQGDTSAEWRRGPFIVNTLSEGEKGQPEAVTKCSGKAAMGDPGRGINTGEKELEHPNTH